MKKVWLILFLLTVIQSPAFSLNKRMEPTSGGENALPNIFIYSIPDDETTPAKNKEPILIIKKLEMNQKR